jgi:predicted DNA-binding transcriptional regulator AlpA
MRCERAAAYLDMSEASFLRLVAEKELPPGTPIRGMVLWDRYELDAAFENWKAKRKGRRSDDAAAIMGLPES